MKKLIFPLLVVSIAFTGCSDKSVSINSSVSKKSPYVRSALKEYIRVSKDPTLKAVAPEDLYKASKIAKVLSNETNPKLANHYAYLLKNQVKIVRLKKKKIDTIKELNEIIVKRNQAIEDAKHQDDVDSDEEEAVLPVEEPNSIKDKFNYQANGDEETFTINGRYFDNDEVIFNRDLKAFISYLVSYLHSHPTKIVVLTSFTDGVGSDAYSVDMALRRANRIKEELVDLDIDEDRVKVDAKGAVEFLASNDSEDGRKQNNRIVVKIK
jgi:outer membrane protein OmpA-like peptidoglycan-associated protein